MKLHDMFIGQKVGYYNDGNPVVGTVMDIQEYEEGYYSVVNFVIDIVEIDIRYLLGLV